MVIGAIQVEAHHACIWATLFALFGYCIRWVHAKGGLAKAIDPEGKMPTLDKVLDAAEQVADAAAPLIEKAKDPATVVCSDPECEFCGHLQAPGDVPAPLPGPVPQEPARPTQDRPAPPPEAAEHEPAKPKKKGKQKGKHKKRK